MRRNKNSKKQRDEHLISLGLIDESKTKVERILLDNEVFGAKFDYSLNKYYIEEITKFPIDITEDEYQELLKYVPKEEQPVKSEPNKKASEDLIALNKLFKILAIIFLILGVILTAVGWGHMGTRWWNPTPFIIGVTSIILSILLFVRRIFIKGFIVIVENAESNKGN